MEKEKKHYYLTNAEIAAEWLEWKKTGRLSERLCGQLSTIAGHMLKSPKWSGYPQDLREEMASEALLKCLKNLKNVKEDKLGSLFNYFTLCCHCSFVWSVKCHYRRLNAMKALLEKTKAEAMDAGIRLPDLD